MFSVSSLGVRGRVWPLAPMLLFAVAGPALAAGAGSALGASRRATVVVPPVSGGLIAAYDRLHSDGLRVTIPGRLTFDARAPLRVARAVPRPGSRVRPGSVVTLYPARAKPKATAKPRRTGYVVPAFVGGAVSAAYGWAKPRAVAFSAHLGSLNAGAARSLLANYRVTAQRPAPGAGLTADVTGASAARRRAGARLKTVTVWGVQGRPRRQAVPAPARVLPPATQTASATVTGPTSVALAGTVNPEASATTYYFSYGPTAAYGAQTPTEPAGAGMTPIDVTASVSGLAAATAYHYRLVATSRAGTTYGADQTFTTEGYYQNPVFTAAAFPDPFVLDLGGNHDDYWAFATGDLFPVLHSTDLVHWADQGTAMTARPSWALGGSGDWHPWAPSVVETAQACPGTGSSQCYVMYYVALSAELNVNCIGVAVAPTPGGPYVDQGPLDISGGSGPGGTPLGCGDAAGHGNIDPSPFVDSDGKPYLYVSSDFACGGGSCSLKPTVSVIPLTADFLHASGARVPLFAGDPGTWEAAGVAAPTVEGPSVVLHDGTYYLFYSGGSWRAAYAMGYATASGPTGPFTKSPANPILSGTSTVLSPGGGDGLVTGPHGAMWTVYAARASSYLDPRTLRLDPFIWHSATGGGPDVPMIEGPTATPQPTQP